MYSRRILESTGRITEEFRTKQAACLLHGIWNGRGIVASEYEIFIGDMTTTLHKYALVFSNVEEKVMEIKAKCLWSYTLPVLT